MKPIAVVVALILGCGRSFVLGHEILGPMQVNDILRSMRQSHATLSRDAPAREKEEALFNIGVEAYALMKLINADIGEHGTENQALIDLAINRCKAMGVNIQPSAAKDYYMYDFEAFTDYLRLAPRGSHVAEVRFALIEKSFYDKHGSQRTPEDLLDKIEEKNRLLRDFPNLGRGADLRMFLILDYLELYAYYADRNEPAKATEYRDRALELCREVSEKYPETAAAAFARNLLLRFGV